MKMIKRYAIEPRSLTSWDDFRYVMEKLGFAEGRVMVALPKKWVSELLDSLDGDIKQSRLATKLQRYKEDRIIQSRSPYDIQMSWVENASALHSKGRIDAILISQQSRADMKESGYPTPVDIDEDFFQSPREIRCLSTVENLSDAAEMLLEVGSEARFIDPYFKITSPSYLKTLAAFAKLAQTGGRCRKFEIFTKSDFLPKGGAHSFNKMLDEYLGPCAGARFGVKVHFLDTFATRINFHARYFLTNKGGLRYDKGFALGCPPELVDISLLDKKVCTELFEIFDSCNNDLGVIDSWHWASSVI